MGQGSRRDGICRVGGRSCPQESQCGQADLLITVNGDGRVLEVRSEAPCGPLRGIELLGKADLTQCFSQPEEARRMLERARQQGSTQPHFLELVEPDGTTRYLLCRAQRLRNRQLRLQVVARDVGERRCLAAALIETQEKFRCAFDFAHIGIALVDLEGQLFEANPQLAALLGYSQQELHCMRLVDLVLPDDAGLIEDALARALNGGGVAAVAGPRFLDRQGRVRQFELAAGLAQGQNNVPLCVVVNLRDVTEEQQWKTMLEQQASLDGLTHTLNRARIEERAREELERADRSQRRLSLVLVDLDHFKMVNDTYGHAIGDQVLVGFADTARKLLRVSDLLGRWGGEEFVLLLPDTGPVGARRLAERLRHALESSVFACGVRITASMGVAALRAQEPFEMLVTRADRAMYQAKQTGRNQVKVDAEDLEWESLCKPPALLYRSLRWKKSYESGYLPIDQEHRQMFEMANRMLGAISQPGAAGRFSHLLGDLLAHLAAHFASEEQMLERKGYPQAEVHRARHRELLAQVGELLHRFRHEQINSTELLGYIVQQVIARHMLQEDRSFFAWMAAGEARPVKALTEKAGDKAQSGPPVA